MRKIFIFLTIILLTLSCSLERSNPLDTNNYPNKVLGIQVSFPENNIVTITWDIQGHANDDGYFIYRSMSYHGFYELIKEIEDYSIDSYEDEDIIMGENIYYFYKMSAFRIIDSKKLEGYRSDPKFW